MKKEKHNSERAKIIGWEQFWFAFTSKTIQALYEVNYSWPLLEE